MDSFNVVCDWLIDIVSHYDGLFQCGLSTLSWLTGPMMFSDCWVRQRWLVTQQAIRSICYFVRFFITVSWTRSWHKSTVLAGSESVCSVIPTYDKTKFSWRCSAATWWFRYSICISQWHFTAVQQASLLLQSSLHGHRGDGLNFHFSSWLDGTMFVIRGFIY